ncbi:hypothetical protein [Pontibacter virosus]|nr:hypothetical protein [Pontibacter virosus]
MKLILMLMLLSFTGLVGKVQPPIATTQDFHFELTVNSTSETTAHFNLLITGIARTKTGEEQPFRLQRDNLKTPFKLSLDKGKYTAVIEATEGTVFSKVQGFENGEKKGYTSGTQKIATMHFEYAN